MGKAPASEDVGLDKKALKPLVKKMQGGRELKVAVGLMGQTAAIQLALNGSPGKLGQDMKSASKDVKAVTFGIALIIPNEGKTLLQLRVNKNIGKVAKLLKKTMKGTGVTKVKIISDEGGEDADLEEELSPEDVAAMKELDDMPDEGGNDAPASAAAAPNGASPPAADAPGQTRNPEVLTDTQGADAASGLPTGQANAAPPAPPAPPAQGAAPPDMSGYTRRLGGLIKEMVPLMSGNAGDATVMKSLAAQAQEAIKANNAPQAGQIIDQLIGLVERGKQASNGAGQNGNGKGPGIGAPAYAKSRMAWVAALKRVDGEVEKLKTGLKSAAGHPDIEKMLEQSFKTTVEPSLAQLNTTLSDKLDELDKATEANAHAKLLGEVRQIISTFQQHAASDPVISQLDNNPFVPVAIGKTITATLSALSSALP